MSLTKDAVIKLVLQYIGGAKIKGAASVEIEKRKAMIRSSIAGDVLSKLNQLGSTLEEVRSKLLTNVKADVLEKAASAVASVKTELDSLNLSPENKQKLQIQLDTLAISVDNYKDHTNILSGVVEVDPFGDIPNFEEIEQAIEEANAAAGVSQAYSDLAAIARDMAQQAVLAANTAVNLAQQYAADALDSSTDANAFMVQAQSASQNATAAAAEAVLAQGVATAASLNANNYAAAAATSAQVANSYSNTAGNFATAAEASALSANTSAGSANTSAQASLVSAQAAASFANAAEQSASVAQIYALQSNTSAASANLSSFQATAAKQNAESAMASAIDAKDLAISAKNDAVSNAAAAAIFATAAATSANSSASSADIASIAVLTARSSILRNPQLFPADFSEGNTYWTEIRTGDPATTTLAPGTILTSDSDFGTAYQTTAWNTAGANLMPRGVIPIIPGKKYEVSIKFKVTASDGSVGFNIVAPLLTSSYTNATVSLAPSSPQLTVTDSTVQTFTGTFSTDTGFTPSTALPSDAKFARLGLRLNTTETAGTLTVIIGSITVTDITVREQANGWAQVANTAAASANNSAASANTSATLSAGYASNAAANAASAATSASQSAANAAVASTAAANASANAASAATSATLSATYSSQAALTVSNQMPFDFTQDGTFWFSGYNGQPADVGPLLPNSEWSFVDVAGIGRVLQLTASAQRDVASKGGIPLTPGRRYRATARVRQTAGATGTVMNLYRIGIQGSSSVGNAAANQTISALNTWYEWSGEFDGDSTLIAAGATHARVMLRKATTGAAVTVQYHYIKLEDITVENALTASVNQAANAAANATSAVATLTNTVKANAGGNPNLCPNGGFENGLTGWSGAQFALVANGPSGNYARTTTNGTYALTSAAFSVYPNVSYTISADTMLFATGGTVYVDMIYFNASGTNVLDGAENPRAASHDFTYDGTGRSLTAKTTTAPATAVTAVARFVVSGVTGMTQAGVRQIKVEAGTLATSYSGEASVAQAFTAISDSSGSIATLKTMVTTGGGNLLNNTDFADGYDGWTTSTSGQTGVSYVRDLAGTDWKLVDEHNIGMSQANATSTGNADYRQYFTAEANHWYDFSCLVASHRCNIQVYIQWLNSAGSVISTPTSGLITPGSGGTQITGWTNVAFKALAPAGTVRALLFLRKFGTTSGTDSYAWWCRPQVRECTADTTAGLPYSPGSSRATVETLSSSVDGILAKWGVTVTTGNKISGIQLLNNGTSSSFNIDADSFSVSKTSGARTTYASGAWKIYDANNALRVQLGNLDV